MRRTCKRRKPQSNQVRLKMSLSILGHNELEISRWVSSIFSASETSKSSKYSFKWLLLLSKHFLLIHVKQTHSRRSKIPQQQTAKPHNKGESYSKSAPSQRTCTLKSLCYFWILRSAWKNFSHFSCIYPNRYLERMGSRIAGRIGAWSSCFKCISS